MMINKEKNVEWTILFRFGAAIFPYNANIATGAWATSDVTYLLWMYTQNAHKS